MIYLSQVVFPKYVDESEACSPSMTCYNTAYPFEILSRNELRVVDFEPTTIFYGSNGSGKTTALNVIAELIGATREALYNRSTFFEDYLRLCKFSLDRTRRPREKRIITSDDVFEFMLNLRELNEGIDRKRNQLFGEYENAKYTRGFRMQSLDDYEELKRISDAQTKSKSQYVRERLGGNVREQSNGESAIMYFTDKIKFRSLYLLDEPENSLSPERQLELKGFIEDAAQLDECQIIMATHSPFLLSVRGAKIYDLDADPVDVKKWTELPNVRMYKEFFDSNAEEF